MHLKILANGEFELDHHQGLIAVSGLTADSRMVKPGDLFFAMAGTNSDGVSFIPKAVENGAIAVISHRQISSDSQAVPVFVVDDPRITLSRMAATFYRAQPNQIVAVTGTAGKTSVAAFVRQIWEEQGFSAASIGTTGVVAPGRTDYGNLTTPDPVALHKLLDALAGEGVSHAAMEASSHGLDQHRLDHVKLSAVAFTNLGRDHLDYHPTPEEYFDAKMRLFRDLAPKGTPAIIFGDDEFSQRATECARESGLDVQTVGRQGSFLTLKRVEHERHRQVVEIMHDTIMHRIEFPLAGDFQIANGLVAAGLAIATGVSAESALAALENIEGAPGRLEMVGRSHSGAPAYVDYAHKPEALENVLSSIRPFTSGRIVLVIGCGGDRDPGKREIMGAISENMADVSIVTDDNPRSEDPASIRRQVLAANPSAIEIADRREAIKHAVELLGDGDCLVVAGKGHEEGQIIGDQVLPFSDKLVLREYLSGDQT